MMEKLTISLLLFVSGMIRVVFERPRAMGIPRGVPDGRMSNAEVGSHE